MVTYGGMSHRPVVVPTSLFIFNDVKLRGFWLTRWLETHSLEERKDMLDTIFQIIRDGKLKVFLETWRPEPERLKQVIQRVKQPFRDRKVVWALHDTQGTNKV